MGTLQATTSLAIRPFEPELFARRSCSLSKTTHLTLMSDAPAFLPTLKIPQVKSLKIAGNYQFIKGFKSILHRVSGRKELQKAGQEKSHALCVRTHPVLTGQNRRNEEVTRVISSNRIGPFQLKCSAPDPKKIKK